MVTDTTPQVSEIAATLRLFVAAGDVGEIRVIGSGAPFGIFFSLDQIDKAATLAANYSKTAKGVYLVMNRLAPALASRPRLIKNTSLTKDADIARRQRVLIDFDPSSPDRGPNDSATDDEKEAARERMVEVDAWLSEHGWPAPIVADSGNGWHLLFAIDLPNDEKSRNLIRDFLVSLSKQFSDDQVAVDISVHNASRITKLYGTLARKGEHRPQRPHRLSRLVSVPEDIGIVSTELIVAATHAARPVASVPTSNGSLFAERPATSAPPVNGHADTQHTAQKLILPPTFPVGGRHDLLTRLAGAMRSFGSTEQEIFWTLKGFNKTRCGNGKPDDELQKIARDYSVKDVSLPMKALIEGASATPPTRPILPAGVLVRARDRDNYGDVVSDDGGATISVHFVSPDGVHATVDLRRDMLVLADGSPVVPLTIMTPPMLSVRDLVAAHQKLRPPLIHGLLREGETMNIIAATKIGKSWLAILLALDFSTRRKWLGRFDTVGGDVLIIDNELHAETSAYRIPAVATANMTHLDEYADHVSVMSLRGCLIDLPALASILSAIEPGRFKLIILDAFYRFLPPGTDENDNGAMAALYNLLDQIAAKVQCAIVCIHHSSKGSQAGKSVTDVGSGAGSMSRAADCHVVLRPHEKENVVVMEAAARSWPPLEPLCLRWEFPIFSEDTSLDPTLLRPERPRTTEKERSARLAADVERILELLRKSTEPLTRNEIRDRLGLNGPNFNAAFADVLSRSVLTTTSKKLGNGHINEAFTLDPDSRTSG